MDKKLPIIIGAAILVVLIVAGTWLAVRRSHQSNTNQQASSGQPATSTASSTPKSGTSSGKTSGYTKAVETYDYRIQFSQCHGSVNTVGSGTLSVKKGVRFMLDNRDPVAHTIAYKGVSVRVPGYGYAIESASVIGTYPITCDGGGALSLIVNP